MISLFKFIGDVGPGGEKLQFPGTVDGFPVMGPAQNLRDDEFQNLPLDLHFRSKLFKLWVEEDAREFAEVNQRICSGLYMEKVRHDQWIAEQQHYCVYLEWIQVYGRLEPETSPYRRLPRF